MSTTLNQLLVRSLAPALSLVAASLLLASPGTAQDLRIMPLGDSITESQTGFASYRYWLWQSLEDFGFCADFVGNEVGVNGTPLFTDFDQDHEGHSGIRADQVRNQVQGWAAAVNPDVVMIHIGTNDLWQGQSPASTRDDIAGIIDEIRIARPRAVILLAQIIPMGPADVVPLNALLPALVAAKNTEVSPVVLVDQFTGFNLAADTWDNVHPNESGEIKIANNFFDALMPFLFDNNCFGFQYCFGDDSVCPCANGSDGGGGCGNSANRGARLTATAGSRDAVEDDLVLAITDMPANNFGIAFMGATSPMVSFGDGLRCVGGIARRFNVQQADSSGSMLYGPGLAALAPVITPGSSWRFQGWYRDPMGPCGNGFNLTNGIVISFLP